MQPSSLQTLKLWVNNNNDIDIMRTPDQKRENKSSVSPLLWNVNIKEYLFFIIISSS